MYGRTDQTDPGGYEAGAGVTEPGAIAFAVASAKKHTSGEGQDM